MRLTGTASLDRITQQGRSKSAIKTFPPYSEERCFHHQHKTLRGAIFETPNRLILKVGTGNIRPELPILFISEPQPIAARFTSGFGPPWSHLLLKTPKAGPKFSLPCLLQRPFKDPLPDSYSSEADQCDFPSAWKHLISPHLSL